MGEKTGNIWCHSGNLKVQTFRTSDLDISSEKQMYKAYYSKCKKCNFKHLKYQKSWYLAISQIKLKIYIIQPPASFLMRIVMFRVYVCVNITSINLFTISFSWFHIFPSVINGEWYFDIFHYTMLLIVLNALFSHHAHK